MTPLEKRAADRRSARQQILNSASRVVGESGAGHLTIDAVARSASMSKGGVLYHFPNKRALLEGMLLALMDEIEAQTNEFAKNLTGDNVLLRSLILAQGAMTQEQRLNSLAILAAAAEDPTLLDSARERFDEWLAQITGDEPGGINNLIPLLAAEGMRFLEMLGLLSLSESDRDTLHRSLVGLAE